MKILVINAGSSSIKFKLVEQQDLSTIVGGIIECIGTPDCKISCHVYKAGEINAKQEEAHLLSSYREGFELLIKYLFKRPFIKDPSHLAAIGHRVVHGGEQFKQSALITEPVIEAIKKNIPLAPIHNPVSLTGINVFLEMFPEIPQVAIFDTAFHQTMPAKAFRYALPEQLYTEYRIRRYGFHGTSHQYAANCAAELLCKPLSKLNLITLHLGNGASAAAIKSGHSIDTSMGLTPLEGLMMGARSGDIDPAIIFYMTHFSGYGYEKIERLLNQESGLLGVCGSNDLREIERLIKQGDERAMLAIDMYCYRIKKYIGAYFAILGGLDGLVFTAGVGENSSIVRLQVCQGLEHFGICINPEKNSGEINSATEIQSDSSTVKILVIPADEEMEIARQTLACLHNG